MINGDCT
jgi:hypothetical protein